MGWPAKPGKSLTGDYSAPEAMVELSHGGRPAANLRDLKSETPDYAGRALQESARTSRSGRWEVYPKRPSRNPTTHNPQ